MNSNRILFLSVFLSVMLCSCVNYLDPYPNGDRTTDDIWEYQNFVQGLVGQCYNNMPTNYDNNEGAYLDGATDDAVLTSSTHVMKRLATGTLVTGQDPFLTYWDRDYRSIYLVNTFLKDRRGYNNRFYVDKRLNELVRNMRQGEAYALRAWFYWDLLQKFGGKGTNGQMLGIPLVLEPLDITKEINLSRSSYDDCVRQIIRDCDSAYKYLPIAHRDFLVPVPAERAVAGGRNWGRFDGITTRALKAMVYLTWASPRFNPENDISRWDSAAVNAKKVIDFKLTVDQTSSSNSFRPYNPVNWFNNNFGGIVISSRSQSNNDAMERMFYPGGFQGNGVIGASQELVNSFPMANGYPIDDPSNRGGYDPTNPYANRDPRFYSVIFYNGAQAKRNNTGPVMYTFENWSNGGKDAAGLKPTNSLTNYHIKKFVFMGLNWSDASISRQPHSKFYIRWAHMLLVFAEAANKVVGPTNDTRYGMSAQTAIQYLRARKTYDNANGILPPNPMAPDPYLAEVAAAGADAFDALVRNERRIETCFEGMRFFDLRRWTTDLTDLNKTVHGVSITQNPDLSFTYEMNKEVEKRSFSSAYLPIPYSEMLKMSKLVQNEGWDGWN
ncbi:MAG: RagB/SusD family nutrient uptake outer membrane protein [Bacteroidales bacterium]